MRQWIWKRVVANGYDVGSAIDACARDFAELEPIEQRQVIRAGFQRLVAEVTKRQKLTVTNGHTDQMPLFASVFDGQRWLRVDYLRANLDQLRQMFARESKRNSRSDERLARLATDIGLYEHHHDAPDLETVWKAEHVDYRLEEDAA